MEEFDESLMRYVWTELKERFGFNIKAWERAFRDELKRSAHQDSEAAVLLRWGNQKLNPILNSILARKPAHPTWHGFLEYIVRKYKSAAIRRNNNGRGYYKRA